MVENSKMDVGGGPVRRRIEPPRVEPYGPPGPPNHFHANAHKGRELVLTQLNNIGDIRNCIAAMDEGALELEVQKAETGLSLRPWYPVYTVRRTALAALRALKTAPAARPAPTLTAPPPIGVLTQPCMNVDRGRHIVFRFLRSYPELGHISDAALRLRIKFAETGRFLGKNYPVGIIGLAARDLIRTMEAGTPPAKAIPAPPLQPPAFFAAAVPVVVAPRVPEPDVPPPRPPSPPPTLESLDKDVRAAFTDQPSPSANEICAQIGAIFPHVDPAWLAEVARKYQLRAITEFILSQGHLVPRRKPTPRPANAIKVPELAPLPPPVPPATVTGINYFEGGLTFQYDKSHRTCVERAIADRLPKVSLPSIRAVLKIFGWNFAAAFKALYEAVESPKFVNMCNPDGQTPTPRQLEPQTNVSWTVTPITALKMLKRSRVSRWNPLPPALAAEVAWVDARLGITPDTAGDSDPGPAMIECEICFDEQLEAHFVYCRSEHAFCVSCLQRQATERVYGQGAADFACLEPNCLAGYTETSLRLFLSPDQVARLNERAGTQAAAVLSDFSACKYCPWGAVFEAPPEVDKVFNCGGCGASFCRLCQRDWDDEHLGKRCSELEAAADAATAARKRREELLTAAVLRVCHNCGLQFQKEVGCNRMTCTCKATSCYLCRKPDIGYDHFCRHARSPGKACSSCAHCSLWETAERVDAERTQAAAQQAH